MIKSPSIRSIAAVLFVVAVFLRLTPHAYNVAAIGALGMFVGCHWSARMGVLISLAAMALSDVLGHFLQIGSMGFYSTALMLTVYLSMGFSGLIGKLIQRLNAAWHLPLWAGVPGGALLSTAVFFLVTNFASWLDPQMMYPPTLVGLMECYVAGVPFVQNTLIGNMLFSALFFGGYAIVAAPAPELERQIVR